MSRAVNLTIKPLKNRKGRSPDSPESMIRRFIRKSKKAGILDEAKKRKYYKKPSQIKREKAIRRKRELAKLERKKR